MSDEETEEEAIEETVAELEADIERRVSFTWISLDELTERQEEYVRNLASEMGFENLQGFAGYMATHQYDYYDVIRSTCRE
jgi:hypothetical protein